MNSLKVCVCLGGQGMTKGVTQMCATVLGATNLVKLSARQTQWFS